MSNRDHLFPAVSIGRSQGQTTSSESLTAHPLLSPSPTTPNPPEHGGQRSHSPSNAPRYVPYTPRQRGTPTAATTTGMTTHPSVVASASHQHQGGATSKLQLMNLKAAAQNVGLDTGSVGWAILEKLVAVASEGGEWAEIWSALSIGKATLLLPLEQAANNEKITAEFVKDHVILCDGPSRKNAHIITLSGLRGTLDGNTLTLRSTLHFSSKTFNDLLAPVTRSPTLATLAPLPHLPTTTPYPMFGVPSYTPALPFPPRTPPPLPPRPPLSRSSQLASSAQSLPSRLPNPFSSLFGSHGGKHPHPPTQQASPPASIHEASSTGSEQPLDVAAFTLAHRIVRKDAARAIDRALRAELHAACGAPPWVAERVDAFVAPWYPFTRLRRGGGGGSVSEKGGGSNYVIGDPLAGMLPDEIGEMVQGFYVKLEEDLRAGGHNGRRKASETSHETEDEKEKEEKEAWVLEVLGCVERAICVLFFDRLFSPPSSDDSSHDQALSSRVAALNMLDLDLEHLGVDVPPEAEEGLARVIKACGQVLSSLELHQSPAEKAAIMVQAHREGLSRLPRIRLLTEEEERARASSRKLAPPNILPDTPGITVSPTALVASPASISMPLPDSAEAKPRGPPPPLPLTPPPPVTILDAAATSTPPAPGSADALTARPELVPLPPSYTTDAPTETSPPLSTPTPVSSDVLLPLIIFAVVKSNPPRLVSHLLYTQRFRVTPSGIAQGEEAFCLVNLMAVAEFLENVDLEALGLGDGGIRWVGFFSLHCASDVVDSLAGNAGRVLTGVTGVVDSSFGMLRQFLPGTGVGSPLPVTPALDSNSGAAPWNFPHVGSATRPGFGLLRRETGFSIGGISIGGRSEDRREEELREVSRPGSLRGEAASDEEESEDGDEGEGEEDDEEEYEGEGGSHDARSIRSFESMMSRERSKGRRVRRPGPERKSLTDRLAHGSPPPRRDSLLPAGNRFDTPISSRPSSPAVLGGGLRLLPPNPRFLDCAADDLRLAEVAELLRDYRRLVDGVRAVGGFVGED
ncbi:hypothetical protein DFH07DRAFT_902521 [Mycena maculata]|uniref:VPS9 domain-containing protein n=1 Tax=Mycena maculata TaxID=230809 RepID=A0AAD7NNM4_9AGAR|nr:hypothetical protein DFH07DRAFT_902521 [Mycena maculata]